MNYFRQGVHFFINQFLNGNRDTYVALMLHGDGYRICVTKFHEVTGRFTKADIEIFYEKNDFPEWVKESFRQVEQERFGEILFDHL